MEFLQLMYFRHAAGTENFSHTAKSFLVPPSSVSLSIKKLEDELGTRLFDRSANRLTLNENGRAFLRHVENIFEELDSAKGELLDLQGKPCGRIRMLVNTNRRLITKSVSDFRCEYPNVSFMIDLDESKDYKNYDIMITDSVVEDGNFDRYILLDEEIMLALPPGHPMASRKQVDMSMLKNEKFICMPENHSLRNILDRLCRSAGFSPDVVIECDDPFYIREYLKIGMGMSIIPMYSWGDQLDGSVPLIRINDGVYRRSRLYVNKTATSAVRIFAERVKVPKI